MRALVRLAFDDLSLHRLSLSVFDFNGAAISCYERVGFVKEGHPSHRWLLEFVRDGPASERQRTLKSATSPTDEENAAADAFNSAASPSVRGVADPADRDKPEALTRSVERVADG
jgi:hypothetical protein